MGNLEAFLGMTCLLRKTTFKHGPYKDKTHSSKPFRIHGLGFISWSFKRLSEHVIFFSDFAMPPLR